LAVLVDLFAQDDPASGDRVVQLRPVDLDRMAGGHQVVGRFGGCGALLGGFFRGALGLGCHEPTLPASGALIRHAAGTIAIRRPPGVPGYLRAPRRAVTSSGVRPPLRAATSPRAPISHPIASQDHSINLPCSTTLCSGGPFQTESSSGTGRSTSSVTSCESRRKTSCSSRPKRSTMSGAAARSTGSCPLLRLNRTGVGAPVLPVNQPFESIPGTRAQAVRGAD